MLHDFLTQNFGLPGGGLYSNLIASALLASGAFIYGRLFEKRAIQRHEDMKRHISAEHKRSRKHLEETMAKRKR